MTARLSFRVATAATAAAFLLAGIGATGATAAPPAPSHLLPTKVFANCTALKKVYPGGVAKSKSTVNLVSGKKRSGLKSTTKVSASLYKANIKLDRDKDGWACES